MKWKKVTEHVGILDFKYAGVPYYMLSPEDMVLFDSGAEPLPDVFDALDEKGIRIRAVLQTHLHIDHVANNPLILQRYGADFYADEKEIAWARSSSFTEDERYADFDPDLYHPFSDKDAEVLVDGVPFRILPTPGHSVGHTAFLTPDRVLCSGDCFISQKVLDFSKLPYMMDIEAGIASMLRIAETECSICIPAHKGIVRREKLKEVIFNNIMIEGQLSQLAAELVDTPMTEEELTEKLFGKLHLSHMREVEWVCYMIQSHIRKTVRRGRLKEEKGLLYRP